MVDHALGAHPSPPDPRDWPLSLAPLPAVVPRRYVCTLMPPVLNQGSKPQCVAYAHAGMKSWQERRDGHGFMTWDTQWLYDRCKAIDNIPGDGTDGRSALRVLKGTGLAPASDHAAAYRFRIAAYYRVPLTIDAMKAALMQYGPLTVGGAWYESWFHPVKGINPAPAGGVVGGHEVLVFGWDDDVNAGSLLVRNSWGRYRGSVNGNFYGRYAHYLPSLWEAWKAVDVITGP